MWKNIANLIVFQMGWLVCVIAGDLYAVLFTCAAFVFHYHYLSSNRSEWLLIGIIAAVGCLWDLTIAQFAVLQFTGPVPLGIPVWLICLWLLFATTFQHSMAWLKGWPLLSAIFAAILGPASYWSGTQLAEVRFGLPIITALLVISAGWAILFPAGLQLAARLGR